MSDGKSHYKVVKNNLANILKDKSDAIIIQQAAIAVHRTVIHTLQFIKLYFLSSTQIIKIDHHFVMCCMRVVREVVLDGRTKNQDEYTKLARFFSTNYRSTMSEADDITVMKMKNITQILDYAATTIVTEYETNIKQHFAEYVERFINVVCKKKEKCKDMDANSRNEFMCQLRSYKSIVLDKKRDGLPEELSSHIQHVLPSYILISDKHINYELAKNPQAFLPCMVYMMRFVESKGEKMMNVFPCRTHSKTDVRGLPRFSAVFRGLPHFTTIYRFYV